MRTLTAPTAAALVAAACTALPFSAVAGQEAGIADLAPARSFLVIGVKNWGEARGKFEASELGALWKEPSVQAYVERLSKEPFEELAKKLEEADLTLEDFRQPTGHVGLAMFLPEGGGDAGAMPEPAMLIVAEFGENAEAMQEALDRLLERGVENKELETEDDEYAGVTITTITPLGSDEEEDGQDDEFGGEGVLDETAGALNMETPWHFANVEGTFVFSTDLRALEFAIDGLGEDGGAGGATVAEERAYIESLAQHPEDAAAYGVVVLGPVWEMLDAALAPENAPPGAPDMMEIWRRLGATKIQAASLALRLGTQDGIVEQTLGVLAPEKEGLVGLFSNPAATFEPPAFVGPDVESVSQISFAFPEVMGLVREVIASLPEAQRAQAGAALQQVEPMAGPALDAMGPNVYFISTLAQPLGAESELTTVAIQLRDQVVVSNVVGTAAQMAGGFFQPRDFNGNIIYTSEMAPVAIGIGFDHLFIGQAGAVENAMRAAGSPDNPRLATEPSFQAAARVLPGDGVMYQFTDMRRTLEWSYWNAENARDIYAKEIEAFGEVYELTPEDKQEMLKEFDESFPAFLRELPPIDVVLRHLGDVVTELRPTPDGFRGRTVWLRPER